MLSSCWPFGNLNDAPHEGAKDDVNEKGKEKGLDKSLPCAAFGRTGWFDKNRYIYGLGLVEWLCLAGRSYGNP